ncbi:MAG TPA: glycosyltransferase family 4 protein [Actinomycetota bacterium]|nr:glycosyltransferase family 4 protein [Actinomycetota bacterium]
MALRLLHLASSARRRGAQVFTAQLVGALRGRADQRVAILHGGPAEVRFPAPTRVLPGERLRLPVAGVSVAAVAELRRAIRGWDPHVVQFSGGELLKHVVPAAAGHPARLVYRRIGSAVGREFHVARRALFRALLRRVSAVVAVGEEVRRETVEMFGLAPDRVVTIPGGRDPASLRPARDRAAVRRELGLPEDAPVLVWVGALTWEKDPLAALELLGRVRRGRPDARLVVSGDGPLRAPLEAAVEAARLDGAVRVLGSRSDVPDLLGAADVVVLTSRTEGIPGSLIEAGMMGLPSVAYGLVDVPEVVVEGRTGLLAPPGDVDALAAAVLRVVGDPDEARRLGEAARARCTARFGLAPIAERYLALYRELGVP